MRRSSRLVGLCLLGSLPAQPGLAQDKPAAEKVSFYFAAHQDDWQLFMNPSAFQDVSRPGTKVVFVHMTAGDAGLGTSAKGRKHPFYLARDNGAEQAIRFMADGDQPPVEKVTDAPTVNGHAIYRVRYRNTVSYFLRVPDGNASGAGYAHTGFQSLRRLAEGKNPILAAVDGSAVYRGWSDLVATLRTIIDSERGAAPIVQLNVAELDQRSNAADHSDHLTTAQAALDAASRLACARRVYYIEYASWKMPENLDPQQRDLESSVFAVTAAGVRAFDHSMNWRAYDQSFVGRHYFRVEEGSGPCDGAPSGLSVAGRHATARP
jgi:LmbE family N-acetylglucosaminyl deacetylase